MNKITFYIFLLHGLFLGILTTGDAVNLGLYIQKPANAVSVIPETSKNQKNLGKNIWKQSQSQKLLERYDHVWVINQQQQAQSQPFTWVAEKQYTGQQPFLQADKSSDKPDTETPEKSSSDSELEPFDEVVKDTEKLSGLFNLYRHKDKNKIYLEIKPEQLNKNYLATATLESGIGERGIYSGMPLQDFLFYFKRVNNNLQFVIRNVNFRTQPGDPQVRSLARSFSDSILYNISLKSIHPERQTLLIDLSDLLLTDLAGLSLSLGVSASTDQSYFGNAKAFSQNIEVESVLNFSGGGSADSEAMGFSALADSRGFTLRIHYSLSQLPENNYRPRLADERVGYFITAYQNLSKDGGDPFVRYINRWHLEKKDPTAAISPPKQPIIFWVDNAVPFEYRDAIKEGVLMWNQAFLKTGLKDAIEVRQMPDDATWDPADIRYNTIRWINTIDGFFAMGPSRVNPVTGEILNADIIVDASFVRLLKSEYRKIVQPNETPTSNRNSLTAWVQNRFLCRNSFAVKGNEVSPQQKGFVQRLSKLAGEYDLCYGMEAANQLAYGSLAMSLLQDTPPSQDQMQKYIHQYLRLIIAHEVGHTLGLRHNFRGSTMLSPEEMNNPEITRTQGMVSSVMDYIPPNIAPQGMKQGDYFPSTVGPYDEWVIQYGYTSTGAKTPIAEKTFLQEIASKSYKPELSYATDEDIFDLDPTADVWDNSNDVLLYSQWQLDNSRLMWERLKKRYPSLGDSYSDLSERFSTVLGNYFQHIFYVTKYIGGQSFYRLRPNQISSHQPRRLPFEQVSVKEQRKALETLQKYVFAEDAMNFSPELLNKLAPSRWYHWGSFPRIGRLDYPIHDLVLLLQSGVLRDLLSGDRLSRLKDIELKTESGEALTMPELFDTLQNGIWTEVIQPKGGSLKISSLRRGLQREYLDILIGMVLRKEYVPEDARTLAWYNLRQLHGQLRRVNSQDQYTKAHLLETRDRIEKALNAPLQAN